MTIRIDAAKIFDVITDRVIETSPQYQGIRPIVRYNIQVAAFNAATVFIVAAAVNLIFLNLSAAIVLGLIGYVLRSAAEAEFGRVTSASAIGILARVAANFEPFAIKFFEHNAWRNFIPVE